MSKYKKESNTIRGQSLNIKDEYYFRPLVRPKFRLIKSRYKSNFTLFDRCKSNRFNMIKYNCRFISANRINVIKKRRLAYYV